MIRIYITILYLLFSEILFSQVVSGVVTDTTGNPVAYVSIGIVDGNRGTISNENGLYKIDLTGINKDEVLRFSSLGYHPVDLKVSSATENQNLNVVLNKKVYALQGVEVHPLKNIVVEFGRKKRYRSGFAFTGIGEGFELAQLFKNNKKVILKKFMFRINSTGYDSILFRIHFYNSNNGSPGMSINNKNIFVTSKGKGWVSKDISAENILISDDFFVSVEAIKGWIGSEIKRSDVIIAGAMKDGNSLLRLACLGYWENAHLLLNYFIEAEE